MKNKIIAICAIIKDEHRYLKEWLDYHLNIGISQIYLYEDTTSKTHSDIVKEYDNVYLQSIGEFIDLNKCLERQRDLYNRFMAVYQDSVDYAFFIDLDEFVMFADDYTIDDLIRQCDEWGGVLLPWKSYGACGHIERQEGNVMLIYDKETYIKFPSNKNACYLLSKSFVKMNIGRMRHHHIHSTAQPIVPYNSENLYTKCWLNHYVTKSWEEWCEKLLVRGQTLLFRKLEDFFIYNPDMQSLKEELYNKEYCKDKRLVVGDKLY